MRIYRASSLGYSLEQLVAGHLGYQPIDPPEWLQEKFDEGTALEPVVIAELRDRGWFIQDEQLEVEFEVIAGEVKVVGHIDGTGHPKDLPWGVVEIKTMRPSAWKDFEFNGWGSKDRLIDKYKWQASAYMLATGKPHYMVAWNKETREIAVEYVEEPFYLVSDIAMKLASAEDHIEKGIVPEGCTDFPCPYFYLHAQDETPIEQADEKLQEMLDRWLEADGFIKLWKKQQDLFREEIIEYIGQEGAGKVQGSNGVTVSVSWQDGGEVIQKRQPKWVTRITGPRKGKDVL